MFVSGARKGSYEKSDLTASQRVFSVVTPAQAGVQKCLQRLDSSLRGNDRKALFGAFYEVVKEE